jgi:hypothetical protein
MCSDVNHHVRPWRGGIWRASPPGHPFAHHAGPRGGMEGRALQATDSRGLRPQNPGARRRQEGKPSRPPFCAPRRAAGRYGGPCPPSHRLSGPAAPESRRATATGGQTLQATLLRTTPGRGEVWRAVPSKPPTLGACGPRIPARDGDRRASPPGHPFAHHAGPRGGMEGCALQATLLRTTPTAHILYFNTSGPG